MRGADGATPTSGITVTLLDLTALEPFACGHCRIGPNDRYQFAVVDARNGDFLQPFQGDLPRPVPVAKIICFAPTPNHPYNVGHPVPSRGALAIVTNVGTGCGGRGSVRRARVRRAGFP
jgi:hypothetical protein